MSDNINFDYKNLSPFKWFVLENFPFIEADFDALTEWQLFCKIGEEINKIIDSQNTVGEQAETLTNAFNNLKNYVDNYFNNLDVQDEINNKLNNMVETGELQVILEQTLEKDYTKTYKTFQELKNDSTLKKGMYVKTLGYNSINDGGNAEYIITDTTDNTNYQENISNNLYATLIIKNILKPEMFGAIGDGVSDDTNYINICISQAKRTNLPIYFTKFYAISSSIKFDFALKIQGIYNMSGLIQTNSNEDILLFDRPYNIDVKGIEIRDIVLIYKTFGNENTTAMRFRQSSTLKDGWGYHECEFRNLIINNAYVGITNEQTEPSWNVHFNNIRLNNISFCAVNINANFGFDMDFIVLGNNLSEYTRNYCLLLNCTGVLRNLDVEDWDNTILYCADPYDSLQIEQVHLERCSINKNYTGFFRFENQYVKVGSIRLYNCSFNENINDKAFIIAYNFISTSRLNVENISLYNCTKITNVAVIYGIYINRISGNNNPQCISLFGANGGGLIPENNMIGGIITSNEYYNLKALA